MCEKRGEIRNEDVRRNYKVFPTPKKEQDTGSKSYSTEKRFRATVYVKIFKILTERNMSCR